MVDRRGIGRGLSCTLSVPPGTLLGKLRLSLVNLPDLWGEPIFIAVYIGELTLWC